MNTKLFSFFLIFVCTITQNLPGQTVLSMAETGAYSVVERSDWRRFDNGRYTGLVRNEVRATILPAAINTGNQAFTMYQGYFYVLQSTLRDMRQSAQPVDAVIPVSFELYKDGTMIIEEDLGFPRMRSFPAFPDDRVMPDSRWTAPGERAVDPFNSGDPAIFPFYAAYEYRGIETYQGLPVHRLHARYASRYRNEMPGANNFVSIQGNHNVDILVRVDDGLPIFMRDTLDETYTMSDGSTVRFAGFTLTFREGIVPLNREEVVESLVPDDLEDSSIDLVSVPEGIRLTIRDIRFVPDRAEFLPEEMPRLDLIAETLRRTPGRNFLVEGHTAAIGQPASEMQLSIERAQRLIAEMEKRGFSANRFIYRGWGGTRPIGDNSTDEGRSLNRRVEITILE